LWSKVKAVVRRVRFIGPTPLPARHPRAWRVRLALLLATLATIAGLLAVWANRQLLNADRWASTSTALLQNASVRTALAQYIVDGVYSDAEIAGLIDRIPSARLQSVAGSSETDPRKLLTRATFQVLGRPGAQAAWRKAQRRAAQQFIEIVEGRSRAVTLHGNAVFVELRPIIETLTRPLGIPPAVVDALPAGATRLKVMSSRQITGVQRAVELLRGLAIVLPAAALLLFALAVAMAEGRRRRTLAFVGADIALAAILVLIIRKLAGDGIVDTLVAQDSVRPAARAVWSIGTELLSHIAQVAIVAGAAVAIVAWTSSRLTRSAA
jgi:hypothetical protein